MYKSANGALLTAVLTVSMFSQAAELHIDAGETYIVSKEQANLQLEQFTIGDKATIRFAAGIRQWSVKASHATIGESVLIDARGSAGAAGAAGEGVDGQAAKCEDGQPGADGLHGARGERGTSVVLRMGVVELGSLSVETGGGIGGEGGVGGYGQSGGAISRCEGPSGGAGGIGGAGGDGGDGGDIRIVYWDPAGEKDLSGLEQRFTLNAISGLAGAGGQGGAGGKGVSGMYLKTSGPTGKKWLRAGLTGKQGLSGVEGRVGRDGLVRIDEDFRVRAMQTVPADGRKAAVNKASTDAELATLRQALAVLQQRVEALEQAQ